MNDVTNKLTVEDCKTLADWGDVSKEVLAVIVELESENERLKKIVEQISSEMGA